MIVRYIKFVFDLRNKYGVIHMKKIEVVAAIIKNENKILCVQRGESKLDYISKKFEFPGGKVEKDESLSDAIVREIKEELLMDIKVLKRFTTVDYTYPDFHITMHSFICNAEVEKLTLTEHIDFKWLEIHELEQLDWAAADIPIVSDLIGEKDVRIS